MPKMTKQAMQALIDELRAIAPLRPLTYGESLAVARAQAKRLRELVGAVDTPAINLAWLWDQKLIPLDFAPSWAIGRHGEDSGMTTNRVKRKLRIFVNPNEPDTRQRFNILHELKHVLDWEHAHILHERLGTGDARLQANMIEWVCNEFAGQVLMPLGHVKEVWRNSERDLEIAALTFDVSREAMHTRLERLNMVGRKRPRPTTYFRQYGRLWHGDASPTPCAA